MQTLSETILAIVSRRAGISDSDLAFAIHGRSEPELVDAECRLLAAANQLERRARQDGVIGNYLTDLISD